MAGRKYSSNADYIISVESRKGGVGKTTAALCLGSLLREKNYTVLLLDLDLTGTNASDIGNSPYWRDTLHVVLTDDGPLNLLSLFESCFLNGYPIPSFHQDRSNCDDLHIDPDKVNIIGSQIYRNHTDTENGEICIERPGIIFDDLHTLWLLEFLKQLILNFKQSINNKSNIAVILDNSPGYIGVSPAIHEWLTDIGPDRGKFLTVTSLDHQDMSACERSMSALHELYSMKWETCKIFQDIDKHKNLRLKKTQEGFFLRLATSSDHDSGVSLSFYHSHEKSGPNRGEYFKNHPHKYTGTILNRVPRSVKDSLRKDSVPAIFSKTTSSLARSMNLDSNEDWRQSMVSYSEYIENQFHLQALVTNCYKSDAEIYKVIKSLKTILVRISEVSKKCDFGLTASKTPAVSIVHKTLLYLDELLTKACTIVSEAGFDYLSNFIRPDWMPGRILSDLTTSLTRILKDEFILGDFSSRDLLINLFDDIALYANILKKRYYDKIVGDNNDHQELFVMIDHFGQSIELMNDLVLSNLSLTQKEKKMTKLLFGMVFTIEVRRWTNYCTKDNHRIYQHFLAHDFIDHSEFGIEYAHLVELHIPVIHSLLDSPESFISFYNTCTTVQSRLIDCGPDSEVIVKSLIHLIACESNNQLTSPYVQHIAEDAIVNKTLKHTEIEKKLTNISPTIEYFNEFMRVLRKVVDNWEIAVG